MKKAFIILLIIVWTSCFVYGQRIENHFHHSVGEMESNADDVWTLYYRNGWQLGKKYRKNMRISKHCKIYGCSGQTIRLNKKYNGTKCKIKYRVKKIKKIILYEAYKIRLICE